MTTIVQIQALRAAAAISVVLVHFNQILLMLQGTPNAAIPLFPLSSGVDVFFVISGFIMVYSSDGLFGEPGAWKIFLWRRLARIVPLYWLTTFAMAAFTFDYIRPSQLLLSMLFIPFQNYAGAVVPVNGAGWTLNYEMFFYVVFATTIALPKVKAVLAVSAALVVVVILGQVLRPGNSQLLFWTNAIILEFGFGAGLALLYSSGTVLPVAARIALVVAGISAIWIADTALVTSGYRFMLWGIPAVAIFAGAVFGPRNRQPKRFDFLANTLGDASYAIYLIHPLAGAAVFAYWASQAFRILPLTMVMALAFFATIAISIFAHRMIEKKATRAFRSILERPKPADSSAPVFIGRDGRQ